MIDFVFWTTEANTTKRRKEQWLTIAVTDLNVPLVLNSGRPPLPAVQSGGGAFKVQRLWSRTGQPPSQTCQGAALDGDGRDERLQSEIFVVVVVSVTAALSRAKRDDSYGGK